MQEHAVWASSQFWEATFYRDVQQQIRQLYAPRYEENLFAQNSQAAVSNKIVVGNFILFMSVFNIILFTKRL